MASRNKTNTVNYQNPTTFQPTNVPPTAVPLVKTTIPVLYIDMPDAPPRVS